MNKFLCVATLLAFVAAAVNGQDCEYFLKSKEEAVTPGTVKFDLKVGSEEMPHPVSDWFVTLVFDKEVKSITAPEGISVDKKDGKAFKIRQPSRPNLPPFKLIDVGTLTINYEGQEAPTLAEYYLKSVQLCPLSRPSRPRP